MRADFARTNKNHLDQSLWRTVAVDKERTDMISKRMIKSDKNYFYWFQKMNIRYIHITKNGEGVDINIGDDDGSKPASKASVKIKIEVFYHLISLTVSQHLFLMAFPQRHLVCFTKYAMPSFCHRHRWRPTFASLPHYYPTPPILLSLLFQMR